MLVALEPNAAPDKDGGLGTTKTSAIFLVAILELVIYLAVTKRDVSDMEVADDRDA